MKQSAKFIECFDPAPFDRIEPKAELRSMHLNAFHRTRRRKQRIELRRTDVVKFVQTECVADATTARLPASSCERASRSGRFTRCLQSTALACAYSAPALLHR